MRIRDHIDNGLYKKLKQTIHKQELENKVRQHIWVTAAGDDIPVIEMESAHISNTISLLKRKKLEGILKKDENTKEMREFMVKKWVPIFEKELEKRAQDKFVEVTDANIEDLFPNMKGK